MNYPSRKQSVPDNLHKPPSPKESDVVGDPLMERPKQSPVASMSSIKPPSTYQPLFVLQQQQQQKVLISQTKPSPPLTNKRSTAIPRKPLATSTKNHSDQLDLEYNQMNLTKSISSEELSSSSMQSDATSIDGPLSPPAVMENQSERTFTFAHPTSINQQQVSIVDYSIVYEDIMYKYYV